MSRDYIAFGLRIRSAIAIPGAILVPGPGEADVEIAFGTGDIGDEEAAEGPYRVGRHGFDFTMPGVARYLCLDGNRMLIDPDPGASEDDIAAMLIATALPALLWSRGDVVLHAAAFRQIGVDGAVAVAGPSGSGKSTILAQQLATGHASMIADDSVCLRLCDEAVFASGLPGGYYDPVTSDGMPRRFNPVPAANQGDPYQLRHVLVLNPDLTEPVELRGRDALQALLANRHRPRIARLMGREAAMLPIMAAICRSIRVYAVPSRTDDIISSFWNIFDIRID